jgi:hypothetical protein
MNASPRRNGMPTQRRFLNQGREKRTRENLCALSGAEAILRLFVKSVRTIVSFSVSLG